MYYTYIIRCEDNSLYCGITTDIERRFNEHFNQKKEAAKYTKSHKATKIEAVWESRDKSLASKLEYRIKELSKKDKEEMIMSKNIEIVKNIDVSEYKNVL